MTMSAGALSRRTFLVHAGRGSIAIAVLGVAACAPAASASPSRPSGSASATGSSPEPSPSTGSASASAGSSSAASPPSSAGPSGGGVTWQRVNLGFVSAYILVRGGEAAVVDTGVSGSAGDIEAGLGAVGLDWGAVGSVILTHLHGDHVGSAAAVMTAASAATGYAGAEDIPSISVPRPLVAAADGDTVFGLTIVATPGHTAGHIAVLDEVGGILVAGDALRTEAGAPTPPGPQFTADMDAATASIAKLGKLTFETLLVGHGDPITSGASAKVATLAGG